MGRLFEVHFLLLIVGFVVGRPSFVPFTVKVADNALQIFAGDLEISLSMPKFQLSVYDQTTDKVLLETAVGGASHGTWDGVYMPIYDGYLESVGTVVSSWNAAEMDGWSQTASSVTAVFRTGGLLRRISLTFSQFQQRQFSLHVEVDDPHEELKPTHFTYPVVGLTFETDANEGFFGFGQRWASVNQRGKVLYLWTEDGSWAFFNGTRRIPFNDASYVPTPFFVSSRGYAFELNTTRRSEFDMAYASPTQWSATTDANFTDVVFYFGTTPAASLEMFVEQHGATLIPPPFVFGAWKQMGSSMPNATDLQVAARIIQEDIPISLSQGYVHFFPDGGQRGQEAQLTAQNAEFHRMGMKSTCYFNPYVSESYQPVFSQLSQLGYFCTNSSGLPYEFAYDGDILSRHFTTAQIDFTNPAASQWYQDQIAGSVALGFDGFMYDFAEYTPLDSFNSLGQRGFHYHNQYPELYQKSAFDYFTGAFNASAGYAPDFVFWTRSGYTNTGALSWAHWTGDASSNWELDSGLPAQISACLSIGLSGVPFCGSDTGGYVCELSAPLTPELLCRWLEYSVFAGLMRDETQGSDCNAKRSQIFSTNLTQWCWRKYAKLRTQLFPYVYTVAHITRQTGLPLMRHHLLSYPDDAVAVSQTYQYSFGDSFLVAPVISPDYTSWKVYLPHGSDWVDVMTNCVYDSEDGRFRIGRSALTPGGQYVSVAAAVDVVPLFVRAGSIIPAIDPSVSTLVPTANYTGVTTITDRAQYLHLWIWPDSSNSASGSTFDGGAFSMQPLGVSNVTFSAVDPLGRVLICQLVATGPPHAVVDAATGLPLPQASGWQSLVQVSDATQASATFFDAGQGVLWMRLRQDVRRVTVVY
eukprot:TRINITY_DN4583_c0_g1_i1.p1 TRINITY_DN4583_c0_g1~~TRINITY_DN4583_c0_g1_i1.p1  ORF type:complete len:865 (+),score=299.14 TRINITY_DN4583_c0_g1_i1:645-3239(+)